MGMGIFAIDYYNSLGLLKREFGEGRSVCDLGSQDVWHPNMDHKSGRALMEAHGYRYVCIDHDGRHGALRLDLNFCLAEDIGERFDIVSNHGTSEHCINQVNIFKLMHDLCKVGGLIIHIVPSWPWEGTREGNFYYYSMGLFHDIAEANDYEKLVIQYVNIVNGNGMHVHAALRRTTYAAFKLPIQKRYQQYVPAYEPRSWP